MEDIVFQISALEKFLFCRRLFGLTIIERQWADNVHTVTGSQLHERVHDFDSSESRGNRVILRGMKVFSPDLGVSGECDAVELVRDPNGVPVRGRSGTWSMFPVEYKKGKFQDNALHNRAQLCCQAMCLEFMFCCHIDYGYLYYISSKKRDRVDFDAELRDLVKSSLLEMRQLYDRRHTPMVKKHPACSGCSLHDICIPTLSSKKSVSAYMRGCGEG